MHHRPVLRRGLNVALAACAFAIASALLPPVVPDAHAAGGGGAGGGAGGGGGGGNEMALRDPDYKAAMDAVKKEDWRLVVDRMGVYAQRVPDSADAWNELGHAYRKLGDMDKAFSHYDRALKIDPKHRGAHEYLGEAYLQIGDLSRAEAELKALDGLCFFPCEEYSDLKAEIRRYKADKLKAST